ncbi:hypothetical protein [Massilia sp. BKSP1R2A-1]|uniref:hypothetical protein n=1 Tax=Massilia sp. BKSP1R2A-1 TaxID=3422595 RepID=UPI003D338A3E
MTVRFLPNQFYGSLEDCRQGGVFDISKLQATAPEREVREHMHVDAHVVPVLSGTYRHQLPDARRPSQQRQAAHHTHPAGADAGNA